MTKSNHVLNKRERERERERESSVKTFLGLEWEGRFGICDLIIFQYLHARSLVSYTVYRELFAHLVPIVNGQFLKYF